MRGIKMMRRQNDSVHQRQTSTKKPRHAPPRHATPCHGLPKNRRSNQTSERKLKDSAQASVRRGPKWRLQKYPC